MINVFTLSPRNLHLSDSISFINSDVVDIVSDNAGFAKEFIWDKMVR